jgi:hypothetical protein
MFKKLGISQSLYYINNKHYLSIFSNIESIIEDSMKFYNEKKRREIIIATDLSNPDAVATFRTVLLGFLVPYDHNVTNNDLNIHYKFIDESEITAEYFKSLGKKIVVFTNPEKMVEIYTRYSKAQLIHLGKGDMLDGFIRQIYTRDIELSSLDDITPELLNKVLNKELDEMNVDFSNEDGKLWGFDIMFYIQDVLKEDTPTVVQDMINLKFNIHSDNIIEELISHLIRQYQFYSVITNMLDYLVEKNSSINKERFISEIFKNNNKVMSLYKLKDLWDLIENTEGTIERITNHSDWEYLETFTEFKRTIGLSLELLNRGITNNIKEHWGEIEFLSKRRPRIPYLFFKVKPL